MKRSSLILLICTLAFLAAGCKSEPGPVTFNLSKDRVMAGHKVPLTVFDKEFPTDWSEYNYLVLEMRASTAQRVYLGVTTEEGYNELRFIFYAPGAWIRTAIPLTYFRDLPSGAHDLAATYNHKRPLSYINIDHGTRHPLKGVDSLGVRMHMPVKDEKVEIAKAYLTVEDPGDAYLSDIPAVDEFGQWNLGEFEDKVHSEAELKEAWAAEDAEIAAYTETRLSRFGGDLSRRTRGTGFFRVQQIDGKWWFIDPEGYYFLSISSNGTSPAWGRAPRRQGQPEPLPGLYPESGVKDLRALRFGEGEEAAGKANQLVTDRLTLWGMNTIGNWSSRDVIALNRKPFMLSLGGLGIQDGILGMPDVYAEGFRKKVEDGVRRSTEPYRGNPMLIGYFVGNEPTWSNQELRLCELIQEADDSRPLKQALLAYLKAKGDTPETRKAFVYETFERFLGAVKDALRKYDPNHLNLGIRYGSGVPTPEVLALSKKYFDVYSFNNYGIQPNLKNMDIIYEATGMPMIIGEFHFGTTDRGLGESLVRVVSQEDRGVAYRNYVEKAFSHPALIGTSWFTWYDQPFFGRGDGENYNIGLLDVTDRPYKWMVKAIRAVADDCYDVHDGKKPPFEQELERVGGSFPDIWEE